MIVSKMNYWIIPAITKIENRYTDLAVKNAIREVLGIPIKALESHNRQRHLVVGRQIFCYLMREHTSVSYKFIGDCLDGRDHATIIHNIRKLRETLEVEKFQNSTETLDIINKVQNYLIIT